MYLIPTTGLIEGVKVPDDGVFRLQAGRRTEGACLGLVMMGVRAKDAKDAKLKRKGRLGRRGDFQRWSRLVKVSQGSGFGNGRGGLGMFGCQSGGSFRLKVGRGDEGKC